MVDKKDADKESLIGYIAGKAKLRWFIDTAHINYDLAIRKLAVSDGYKVFTAGNTELALKYYAFENMKKSTSTNIYTRPGAAHQKLFVHDGKKPCFGHNKEGCSRDEKTCNYGHWCSHCGSRSFTYAPWLPQGMN